MKLQALVTRFADSVVGQSDAIKRGDARTGNKYAKDYIAAFAELRSHGNEGREALASLLTHEHADVRVMAAAYLLRYCESMARAVLEKEAKGKGLVAFTAAQALARWEEGDEELDPE